MAVGATVGAGAGPEERSSANADAGLLHAAITGLLRACAAVYQGFEAGLSLQYYTEAAMMPGTGTGRRRVLPAVLCSALLGCAASTAPGGDGLQSKGTVWARKRSECVAADGLRVSPSLDWRDLAAYLCSDGTHRYTTVYS